MSPRELAVPTIAAYEIEYGTLKIGSSRRRAIVSQLLASIEQNTKEFSRIKNLRLADWTRKT